MSGHQLKSQKNRETANATRLGRRLILGSQSHGSVSWGRTPDVGSELPSKKTIQRHSSMLSSAAPGVGTTIARQLQQTYGNSYVQRVVQSVKEQARPAVGAINDPLEPEARVALRSPDISREPEPAKESKKEQKEGQAGPAEGQEGGKEKSFNLVKELLGEKQLEGYAQKASEAAIDKLVSLAKGAKSVDEFNTKIDVAEIKDILKDNLEKGLVELLKSPGGQKVQLAIKEPAVVVAMVLIAMGTAAIANPELALEKKLDLGAGFKGDVDFNLGKLKEISVKKLKAGFSYTSKYFETSVSGGYEAGKGEGGAAGKAGAPAAANEAKFTSPAEVDKEGNLKLDLRQVINWQTNSLMIGQSYESIKGWSGFLQLKLGNKHQYWTPKVTMGSDGNAKFELGHTFTNDMVTMSTLLKGKEEMSHKLDLKNPFGIEGLSINANIAYGLEDPKLKSAGLEAKIKLTEGKKSSQIPALILTIGGKYQAAGPGKAQDLQGSILLVGHWK